jgi:hypothetical protein
MSRQEYEIREMKSVGRQVYGKLLYATRSLDDALENLLRIQNKNTNRKIALVVKNGELHNGKTYVGEG